MNLAKLVFFLATAAMLPGQTANPLVRFHTNQGDIDVTLAYDVAPKTVLNFLNYANKGTYTNTIFHRSVRNFIIQGGGYQLQNKIPVLVPTDAPVVNEFNLSNVRGTIAMAKFGGDPNSATDQWFFNTNDNSANLDKQNGGFTVFGLVANATSMAVVDKIAALPIVSAGSDFDALPVINYSGTVTDANYVVVTSIEQLSTITPPSIKADGIVSASAFGAFSGSAPGGYIEIYGSNMSDTARSWATADFVGNGAPIALDQVNVTINGRPSFVNYISPTQVNVQIPDSFPRSGTYPVVVTYRGLSSAPYSLTIDPVRPGLLAPASFKVDGKQFVAAVHASTGALVANSSIPGVPAAPAVPGETLTIYGTGWGSVTNTSAIAGQINTRVSNLEGTVEISIGGIPAKVSYAGLAVGLVGVDQINVVVPDSAPNGDLEMTVLFNGNRIQQTLYLPVKK